jgi:hypothetical protein
MFVGTIVDGVFQKTETGWTQINTGLSDLYITSLAIRENTLYAGTVGNSVWRYQLSGITKTKDLSLSQKSNNSILKINVSRNFKTLPFIELTLSYPQRVKLVIYNMSGRIVQLKDMELLESGPQKIILDSRSLSSGCYNLQVQAKSCVKNMLFYISR